MREAQNELQIDFPIELEIPWCFLQRTYGTTSASGNLTSNVYYNVGEDRKLVYEVNANMSPVHRAAETWNTLLFFDMEKMVSGE